jgi:hypothetical protein
LRRQVDFIGYGGPRWNRWRRCRQRRQVPGVDQTFAEPSGRGIGTIATASDRQIGAFAITSSIFIAVTVTVPLRFAPSISGSILEPGRSSRRWAEEVVRFDGRRGPALIAAPASFAIPFSPRVSLAVARACCRLVRGSGTAIEILRFHVRDVQEAISTHRKVDERGLDSRLQVDDSPFINIARVALVTGALHVKLFEDTILNDGDTAFLGLKHVDEHFLLHAVCFRDLRRKIGAGVRFWIRSRSVGLCS